MCFELARQNEQYDLEGNSTEEEYWDGRKTEVYKGLESLAEVIKKAFLERTQEAAMQLWSKEEALSGLKSGSDG